MPVSVSTHARSDVARICVPAGGRRWWRLFVDKGVPKRKLGRPAVAVADSTWRQQAPVQSSQLVLPTSKVVVGPHAVEPPGGDLIPRMIAHYYLQIQRRTLIHLFPGARPTHCLGGIAELTGGRSLR